MKGRLWCLRLVLLLAVSAVVFSPLAVRGASLSSQPVGWNHDPSTLLLPSSPTYPAVVIYRDLRMRMTDRSFEKSELLLSFANQDAAAINTMVRRQDYVSSATHASVYQQTFDRCVGWLVIADDRGNDVSYLLAKVKNDHMAQQVALEQSLTAMPEWSRESVEAARSHVAEVLLEAIRLIEGNEASQSYRANITSLFTELGLQETASTNPAPSIVVVSPINTGGQPPAEPSGSAEAVVAAPVITSLHANKTTVGYSENVSISCNLASGDDDLDFSWWCSRGNLVASSTEATWTAPTRAGVYEINVTVSDSAGRSDTRSVEIHVTDDSDGESDSTGSGDEYEEPASAPPDVSPMIAGLLVTAEHKYLDQSLGGGYSMLVSRSATIQCLVDDPAGLDFAWTATGGGRIAGSGDTVVLTVPASPGYVKVIVTATNPSGDEDSTTITVYGTTCTYCF